MRESPEWDSMPLNPDVCKYAKAVADYQMEERQTMVRFAPMLCRCQAWYDWRLPEAPQVDCMIHTTIMFDRDGEWTLSDALHEILDRVGGLSLTSFGVQVHDDDGVGYLTEPVWYGRAWLHDSEQRLVQHDRQAQLDSELYVYVLGVGDQGHDVSGLRHLLNGVLTVVGDEIVPVRHVRVPSKKE